MALMMQAFNLLILILSIIHTGFAKPGTVHLPDYMPGKHFLIETDDTAEEEIADKDEDYARAANLPPALGKEYKEIKDCEPNKEWKEKGCKACSCSPDGRVVECHTYNCIE